MRFTSHLPLHLLTDAEKRGAALALAHIKAHGDRLARTAAGRAAIGMTRADRALLEQAARFVRNAANIVRRDLTPDLKDHDFRPPYGP